ncbi:hypothetical protein [Niabella beijingensis]|nr:hypothetical protein [Niabella beijingensis]
MVIEVIEAEKEDLRLRSFKETVETGNLFTKRIKLFETLRVNN